MRPSMERVRRGLRDLGPAIYRAAVPLDDFRMLPLGTNLPPEELPISSASELGWRAVRVGTRWGGRDENAWFHGEARIPQAWIAALGEDCAVALRLILGYGMEDFFGWPEGLLYVNGRLQQGINRHHPDVLLGDEDARGERVVFDARVWSGLAPFDHRIEAADAALVDRRAERLLHLLAAGADAVEALEEREPLLHALADTLERAYDAVDLHDADGDRFARSAHAALGGLEAELAGLRERYTAPGRPGVTAVGHGHLDVAWLWQTRHTREKTARTFSVATALMERYPEYVFLHTTPQVFAWLKADYPAIYERVRKRVAEGRFEAAGAMWLESDCNLVSGEALVRQILYGERFIREEFGRRYDALWLPDAFGYNAALPQIMLRSGLKTFMTTKLSWSETNRIPADTFWWRGLDGSEVLAHFITTPSEHPLPPMNRADTYNGALNVAAVRGVWERYRQKAASDEVLLSFGHGDGGAGPTRQHLEQARAIQQLPGVPELRLGRADEYFARLRERVAARADLPTWDGELYLEYHRGTYTTQAWLKRAHRQNEARLLLAEYLDAWRWAAEGALAPDRREALDDAWRTLLLHEFHDILPGSSIAEVYADAREALAGLERRLEGLIREDLRWLGGRVGGSQGGLLVFNPSPWPERAVIEVAPDDARDAASVQMARVEGREVALVEMAEIPARGAVVLGGEREVTRGGSETEPARAREWGLENGFFALALNERGEIASFVDKRVRGGRELVQAGQALNRLDAYDDRPPRFDAWDVDATFERKPYPVALAGMQVVEDGPVRATVVVGRRVLNSEIEQRISVYRALPRVDFATRIVWRDAHVLLKAAFPLDLRVRRATHEVQYGAVERPTHRNTSWDQARFETAAHRWVDVSEAGYGVSLLNDGRYGHDVRVATVRLTLLRSPTEPDPAADQGTHEVTYSLYPHLGDWREGGTVRAAYALHRPMRVVALPRGGAGGDSEMSGLFASEPANVVVEAVKRPTEGEGIIVRVYEAHGARGRAFVRASMPVQEVTECDLLENRLDEASPAYEAWAASPVASRDAPVVEGDGWRFALRPFEVRTFRVTPGG